MTVIHTIGHSNHAIERLLVLLDQRGIRRLVDVRSHPYSRWAPQFRRHPLAGALTAAGLDYVFLGEALGGRPHGASFYDANGRVNYPLRARAADFLDGVDELLGLAAERPSVILCAEEDPTRCHRRVLITPALLTRGTEVVHIRGDGSLQKEVEGRALDGQLGLFC